MPASTPPSLNHNSHNTRTGHGNRCVFVGVTHAEKEAMSVNVVSVIKLFSLSPPSRKHTHKPTVALGAATDSHVPL